MFANKTAFITGASRGIGKAIALKLAASGANIVIAAKTTEPHPKLEGTIYSAAEEIEKAGGKALPVVCDIRDEENVATCIAKAVEHFGGIDIVINNASAIGLTPISQTETKRFDLMHDINIRGTFLVLKHAMPHLQKSTSGHILTLSPPINLDPKWLAMHSPYTISKYGMTMLALGAAAEGKAHNVASNCLWPRTTIATAAVQNLLGGDKVIAMSRTPQILADAAFHILQEPASYTGQTLLDDEVLAAKGITDLSGYAVTPNGPLMTDIFL
jgi:citronellol/citronellal dehydrogenase